MKNAPRYHEQVSFWRQAQASVPVLALRSTEQLEGLEGIIVVIDLRQVRVSRGE